MKNIIIGIVAIAVIAAAVIYIQQDCEFNPWCEPAPFPDPIPDPDPVITEITGTWKTELELVYEDGGSEIVGSIEDYFWGVASVTTGDAPGREIASIYYNIYLRIDQTGDYDFTVANLDLSAYRADYEIYYATGEEISGFSYDKGGSELINQDETVTIDDGYQLVGQYYSAIGTADQNAQLNDADGEYYIILYSLGSVDITIDGYNNGEALTVNAPVDIPRVEIYIIGNT